MRIALRFKQLGEIRMKNNEYIYTYTRSQAIEDGMLIAIDEKISREAGMAVPVAITSSVYEQYVFWSEKDNVRQTYQDQSGRLWDILWMCSLCLRLAARKGTENTGSGILFQLLVIPRKEGSRAQRPKKITLKALLDPGDNYEPVLTIMLPNED